jgi:hypothetical protein
MFGCIYLATISFHLFSSDTSHHEHTRAGKHLRLSITTIFRRWVFLGHKAFAVFWFLMTMAFKTWVGPGNGLFFTPEAGAQRMVCNRTGPAHLGMICLGIVEAYWIRSLDHLWMEKSKVSTQYLRGSFVQSRLQHSGSITHTKFSCCLLIISL